MINHFLQQQHSITPKTKHIIKSHLAKKRKYQPFHIDCSTTKKKICYCINNTVINVGIADNVKEKMWKKYEEAQKFYIGPKQQEIKKADQQFTKIRHKIQCLSRKEIVDFVKSIKKEKNLMGDIIEY